ncbi:MAG TPA: ABC transporter ATP-binding protein [Opitutaceae bacterium]
MIQARDVEKAFGARRVLDGLDFEVPPGAVTLLVGANGAGKTTLLRILAGLCLPDRGTVHISGFDIVRERLAALRALAFLPQAPRFHPRLTTWQVGRYYGRLRGRANDDVTQELARWGLLDHVAATTAELSGGLRQRLALAVFSLARAPVLVLDEPGLSLDPEWRTQLQAHLVAEANRGATVLVATHLLAEWEGKVDACVLLEAGRIGGALPPNRLRESFPPPARVTTP